MGKVAVEKGRLDAVGVAAHIPGFAVMKFDLARTNFDQKFSEISTAIESKKGDHKKLTAEAKEAIKQLRAGADTMRTFLDEAEAHVNAIKAGA